jgi:hypothetical protein
VKSSADVIAFTYLLAYVIYQVDADWLDEMP